MIGSITAFVQTVLINSLLGLVLGIEVSSKHIGAAEADLTKENSIKVTQQREQMKNAKSTMQ